MKKLSLCIFLGLLFCNVGFAESVFPESTYLMDVDKCAKKNKNMGDVAWKHCASKIQYQRLSTFEIGGSAHLEYDKENLYSLVAKIKNETKNFIITEIGLTADILGKKYKTVKKSRLIWPDESSFSCIDPSKLNFDENKLSDDYKNCLVFDLSSSGLKKNQIIIGKWSWSIEYVKGVDIIPFQKKGLFKGKMVVEDVESCVKKYLGVHKYKKDEFKNACIFALAKEIDTKNIITNHDFSWLIGDAGLQNKLVSTIENDIGNKFLITQLHINIIFKGDSCGGQHFFRRHVDLKPGEKIEIEEIIKKQASFYTDGDVIPCKLVDSKDISIATWGLHY